MLLYITDSKKTKHAVKVEGIDSIAFENNPAIITFNYLNGSKKELHMVEQDFKVSSDAYVVDKLWEWVNSGLANKPKQLTSFLGKKAKVETVKSVETDKEHSENKTYLRISKFHDKFVEKKVIPVDDITSVTAHSDDNYDYLLFITKHKKYKLVLVYTYNDVYAYDINDNNHAANLIKEDIIDLIQKAKNKGVVTYNPIEFVSFSYVQPYAETGYRRPFRDELLPTWNLEEVFDFPETYNEIQKGKKQDACLYAFNMHQVIKESGADHTQLGNSKYPAMDQDGQMSHVYDIKEMSFIQLGSTRSEKEQSDLTTVERMPPLGFTYDLLGQKDLEGTGKWVGQWAPSKAYYSIQGYDRSLDGDLRFLDSVPENPTFDNVLVKTNIDIDNKIPKWTNWGHGIHDLNDPTQKFIRFWDEQAEKFTDVSYTTGGGHMLSHDNAQGNSQLVTYAKNSSVNFDQMPNVFNPVYGMLCKEDGIYKINVNFEDIVLATSDSNYNNYLHEDHRENVEAYLTIKSYEANTPFAVLNSITPNSSSSVKKWYDKESNEHPVIEHSYGPFLPSDRGFNINSSFIVSGIKDVTFFKFLLTIVNKNNSKRVYVWINTSSLHSENRSLFYRSPNIGHSRENAAGIWTPQWNVNSDGLVKILDDYSVPYVRPVNRQSISLLHIEKIAELPSPTTPHTWQSQTEEITDSGQINNINLRGVSRAQTASGYGYSYYGSGSDGIGTGNL